MSKFTDVIEITSSSDEGEDRESDDESIDEEEEAAVKRKSEKKGREGDVGDVSPSSVVAKTSIEKSEEDDDCCILDFDPFDTAATDIEKKLSLADGDEKEDELSVLAEKGEVACRDFPHSRHLCAEFLFNKTPHESYCPQCYCYVCDTPAPCIQWKGVTCSHCHASDREWLWKDLRNRRRKLKVEPKF